jgi:hypothetical protein
VIQTASKINREIDKLIRILEDMRLALHAAVQRAAQTARSQATNRQQLVRSAQSSWKATKYANELRRQGSGGTLSELMKRKSESEKTCRGLAIALEAHCSTLAAVQLDFSIEKRIVEALDALNKHEHALGELAVRRASATGLLDRVEEVS